MVAFSRYHLSAGAFRSWAGLPVLDWQRWLDRVEARRQTLCATDRFNRAAAWMIADLEACHRARFTGAIAALAAIGAPSRRKAA
jgi:hypothetical protein